MLAETIISVTYIEALTIGLLYGTIFCTSECLPYVASYIAAIGAGFRKGIVVTLIYDVGRLISYTFIGVIIALIGSTFTFLIDESTLDIVRSFSAYVIGFITILIGIHIFLKTRKNQSNCKQCASLDEWKISRNDFRVFTLGLSRGLMICPPLFALLIYSIPFATPLDSISLAFLFGLGTILSPMLILGGVIGWLLNKAPLFSKWISIIGSIGLIILGIGTILNMIIL